MPNVTISGGANVPPGFTIPVTSTQSSTIAANAIAAIQASITAGKAVAISPSVPATVNLAIGSTSTTAILDNGTAPLTVNDASAGPLTIISGLGGLTYNSLASLTNPAANVLIDSGGGPSTINLGFGTATVVVDGVATVNAINGGDTVFATSGGFASINAGAGAVVVVAGTDTVGFYGPNAQVFTQNGANLMIVGTGGPVEGTDSGSVTISALGSISNYQYDGYGGNVYVDASAGGKNVVGNAGSIVINPTNSNVTVFAGAGSETLYGTGDAGGKALNNGSDFVNAGNGFFHGGAGQNILETSTISGGATLIGGAKGVNADFLYSQGAFNTLIGDVNTRIIDASGLSGSAPFVPNFTFNGVALGAGGDLLNAGFASQVSIYGAAGGANTIVSGTGATTVNGAGAVTTPGSHAAANTFIDGEGKSGLVGGSIVIKDFVVGLDRFLLNGSKVTSATNVGGSAIFTLSDSTKVTLLNLTVTDPTTIFK